MPTVFACDASWQHNAQAPNASFSTPISMNLSRWRFTKILQPYSCSFTTLMVLFSLMAAWMLFMLVPSAIGTFAPVASLIPTATPQIPKGKDSHGAVASLSRICSRFGTDILHRGGNAADAVSSITFTICSRISSLTNSS